MTNKFDLLDLELARLRNRTYEPNGSLEQFMDYSSIASMDGVVYMVPILKRKSK